MSSTNKRQLIMRLINVYHRIEAIKINHLKYIENVPKRIDTIIVGKMA